MNITYITVPGKDDLDKILAKKFPNDMWRIELPILEFMRWLGEVSGVGFNPSDEVDFRPYVKALKK